MSVIERFLHPGTEQKKPALVEEVIVDFLNGHEPKNTTNAIIQGETMLNITGVEPPKPKRKPEPTHFEKQIKKVGPHPHSTV
jgi:hypothetical protein